VFSLALLTCVATAGDARRFTLSDEIELGIFGDNSYTGQVEAISWSPNREFLAVHVGRGIVRTNKVQSELRIYSGADIQGYVSNSNSLPPKPLWDIVLATYKEGPIIRHLRWLPSSRAFAFLQTSQGGRAELIYADVSTRRLDRLSLSNQDVSAFDVIDHSHFVYAARDTDAFQRMEDVHSPAVDETGRIFSEAALLGNKAAFRLTLADRSTLWTAQDGPPRPFIAKDGVAPLTIFTEGLRTLRMSPDGKLIATAIPVPVVPPTWTALYRPPIGGSPFTISAGPQDTTGPRGPILTSQFVLIDLARGTETVPLNAPTGDSAGWWTGALPEWSPDSSAVLLPSVFIPLGRTNIRRPCIVTYRVARRSAECVTALENPDPLSLHQRLVTSVRFDGTADRVIVASAFAGKNTDELYTSTAGGSWKEDGQAASNRGSPTVAVWVRQRFDQPPVLIAGQTTTASGRVLWDPNPQLKDVTLGHVSVLRWKDASGRAWSGGLFLPPDFRRNGHYPLVIQTHNFDPSVFRPSGAYPTSYAAQVLAAAGIVVLETRCNVLRNIPDEGTCQPPGYDAAVQLLARQGVIDPHKVGIIGFSRTCYYTLEGLTRSKIHFSAASITDGINQGYWQYLMSVDDGNDLIGKLADAMNGAAPLGAGLQAWIKNAPTFNMGHVNTPLQIFGEGLGSLISMWEPYALLRYQHKPVDLILLNTREHVLTTPAVRIASQGGTVDWMRFWLQGYEDTHPVKRQQYARWETLCDLQRAQNPALPAFCVTSKSH
jgi:dipeptidyl aminopeptidase/acylaminoacyl peptidase